MTLFAILFAIVMLGLWGAAVAGLWVATGALGGLSFAALTVAVAWVVWPSGKGRMTPDTLNAFQRPLNDAAHDHEINTYFIGIGETL